MDKEKFLVGDIVKIKKRYSRKQYTIVALSNDKKVSWIEDTNDKKFKLIKVEVSNLKLITRSQLTIEGE